MLLSFLFAALSLALNFTVSDRVRVLYRCMSPIDDAADEDATTTVPGERVSEMVQIGRAHV